MLWLEDGRLKAIEALVRDPICGMLIDPAQARRTPAQLDGETYLLLRARLPRPVQRGDGA